MIQRILVGLLILASAGYLVWNYRRRLKTPGGCAGCPAAKGQDSPMECPGCGAAEPTAPVKKDP